MVETTSKRHVLHQVMAVAVVPAMTMSLLPDCHVNHPAVSTWQNRQFLMLVLVSFQEWTCLEGRRSVFRTS